MAATSDERLLTTRDVATHCGLSTRAVYDAIRRGELKATRICSRIRIRPEDLDAWLAAGEVNPPRRLRPVPASPLSPVSGSFRALMDSGGRATG
jgi:excisionase family DNA binding protein